MILVRIVMSGLVAVVPSQDSTKACIVMVDATMPRVEEFEDGAGGLEEGTRVIEPHLPAIVVSEKHVNSLSSRKHLVDDGARKIFLLDNEQLTIQAPKAVETTLTLIKNAHCASSLLRPCCENEVTCTSTWKCPQPGCLPYLTQKRDLHWLLKLEQSGDDPNAAKVRGSCFEELPPPAGVVVARVLMDKGILGTHRLERELAWYDTDPENVEGQVEYEGGDLPGTAVASELFLELHFNKADPGELKFMATDLTTGMERQGIEVDLTGTDDLIEIRLMNSPLREIVNPGSYRHDSSFSQRHFQHFYRLSGARIRRIPSPDGTGGDLLCPPVEGRVP